MRTRFFLVPTLAAMFLGPAFANAAPPDKKAERLWKAKCASCHGADGKADTDQGKKANVADMTIKAWQKAATDDQIKKAIKDGVKKTDKHGEMDAYDLSPEQLNSLVGMIRSFGS